MCLEICKPYKHPHKGRGYKVFAKDIDGVGNNEIYPEYIGDTPYKVGEWYTADEIYLEDTSGREYTSGYHIFTKLGDAKIWLGLSLYKEIREVEYEDARASGYQLSHNTGHCVVAQRMKIGKQVVKASTTTRLKWRET